MATIFSVGVEVQTSAAQQAIARLERAFDEFARSSQSASNATQKFDQKLDDATKEINKFTDEMEAANRRQNEFQRGAQEVLKVLGAGKLVDSIKQYAGSIVQLGQATQSAIAANSTLAKDATGLDKAFRELTKELNYSTNSLELNQAAYDVLSAGVSETTDVVNVMKAGVAGAKGGFSDLATMTDAVTTIMNAYGKSSAEAQTIVDMMIATQNDGKIVAAQYGQQIGVVAAGAASAGVKLEELNAAISVATVAGVQVSSTFSGLRQAISSIVSPSEQAKKIAKELGIEFSQAGLQQKGFAGVLKDVAEATKGNAEQITKLFGSVEAKAVIDPILNNLQKYEQFLVNQTETAGAATEAQQKLAGGLQASQAAFANVRKEVEIDIFKTIEPAVTALTNATTFLGKAFVELPEPIQKVAIGIGLLGTALVVATAAKMAFMKMGITTAVVMGGLKTALGLVLSPIGLVVVAVGAAYLAFQQMMDSSEKLRKVMSESMGKMGKAVESIFNSIGRVVDVLTGKYASHEKESKGIFQRMGDWFATFVDDTVRGWEMIAAAFDRYALSLERRAGVGTIQGLSLTEVERGIQSGYVGGGLATMLKLTMESRKVEEEIKKMEAEAKQFRNTGMGIPNVKLEEDIKKRKEDLAEMRSAYNRLNKAIDDYNKKRAEANKPKAQEQKEVTTELEKQAEALQSQLPKQRALADLEIQRLQQRLDLEKAYGRISQEEILRREAAIRLRRNELALANLALEKSEQEQRIKNGENVTPKDFSTQEQALREENTFIQQRLQADTERLNRELRQQESDQRMKAENELFNLRKQHEMEMFRLQREGIQLLQERQLRGRNETEKTVLKLNQDIENAVAASTLERMRYLQENNADRQEESAVKTQLNRLFELYGQTGAPDEVFQRYQELKARDAILSQRIDDRNIEERQRMRNVQNKLDQLIQNRDDVFVDRINETFKRLAEEKEQITEERKLSAASPGSQVLMRAGMSYEELYGRPKERLRMAAEEARQRGDMAEAEVFSAQYERLDSISEKDRDKLYEALIDSETQKAVNQRIEEVVRFNQSLDAMQTAERESTIQLSNQLDLLKLSGDEKTRFVAQLKAQEIVEKRIAELVKQMEGAQEGSAYYNYMTQLIAQVKSAAPGLTQFFYEQGIVQSELNKEIDYFNEQLRLSKAIADGLGDSFAGAFGEFVMGTKSAQEAFAGMMGNIANVFMQEFQRMVAQKAAAGLLGLVGNLFTGGIGGMFGGGGGGDPRVNVDSAFLPHLAEGGIVTKPTMALIGEAGKEAVIPLDKLDGMGNNVTINVSVSNDGTATTDQQNANRLGRELESAVVSVLQKQKRPGGLLASVR